MNEWRGPDEPTLSDVQAAFPGWQLSRGPSGLYYGVGPDGDPVTGEDPLDLRDQIIRVTRQAGMNAD